MTPDPALFDAAYVAEDEISWWDGAPPVVNDARVDLVSALEYGRPPLLDAARALTTCARDRSGWPPGVRDAVDRLAAAVEAVDTQTREDAG